MTAAQVTILDTPDDVARAAADIVMRAASEAIENRGLFHLVLAGGSTPKALYNLLATGDYDIHWPKTRIYFGDERCVPPEHPDSNFRMAAESLLNHVNLCPNCVHRIEAERDPRKAAADYDQLLHDKLADNSPHTADLVLLGLGDDAHTASLFPNTAALSVTDRWCVANFVPTLNTWRITLTFPFFAAARQILFLVAGASKANAVHRILQTDAPIQTAPAKGILNSPAPVHLLLDPPAAAKLSN